MAESRQKRIARDAALAKLRRRMRGLVTELETLLDYDASEWLAFGLNIPGNEATPDAPEEISVEMVNDTSAKAKWPASPRANYYRVYQKIIGVDAEPVAVESRTDCNYTFEALPPNAQIEVSLSAVNDGGESVRSKPVTIVTSTRVETTGGFFRVESPSCDSLG